MSKPANKRVLMISTAALALAVSAGIAAAQSPNQSGGAPGAAGPAAGAAAAPGNAGGSHAGPAERGPSAADNSGPGAAKSGATAQDTTRGHDNMMRGDKGGEKERSASDRSGNNKSDNQKSANDNARDNKSNAAENNRPNANEGKTTGNAATSATAAPPAEKRSQINAAFRQEKITETTNVNFNISVGTRVPGSVRFYPIPERVVAIYPEWRGYDVIFVHGRYIILRPETHEIVYILDV
ncbi:MAG: DUF1236 domain-containing protein [Bradyrhizobiaceae bacterium]|nr:MAG: DUF1236 domain-containing protein [Bradyrhizobiaceae bacterium]